MEFRGGPGRQLGRFSVRSKLRGDRLRPGLALSPIAAITELDWDAGDHRLLDRAVGIGGKAATEDDVVAGAEVLHCLDDLRRLQSLVLTEEVLRVAPPAFHVDGAAEHDCVVGRNVGDLATLQAIDLKVGLARAFATASAISAVEPRFDA